MKDNKVILIKGTHSEWFEHAIFIMKSAQSAANKDIVAEAERIINNYMSSGALLRARQEKRKGGVNTMETKEKKMVLASQNENKTIGLKRKWDIISILINLCIILCSILLGFMLHNIIG